MKQFTLTVKAKEDLREIAIYTESRWGTTQRNKYVKQFDDTFHLLAKNPLIGKGCDEIRDGYFKFPQGSHIIFYRQSTGGDIEIVRILHKNMDVETKITNDP